MSLLVSGLLGGEQDEQGGRLGGVRGMGNAQVHGYVFDVVRVLGGVHTGYCVHAMDSTAKTCDEGTAVSSKSWITKELKVGRQTPCFCR